MTSIRPLVAGNWKMNGIDSSLAELGALREQLAEAPVAEADVMVCPPATLLSRAVEILAGTDIALGGQDCHPLPSGAHSERRIDHGENDALVKAKALAAYRADLTAIICIGETEAEHRDGETLDVLKRQIQGSVPEEARAANTVMAYEPVWAIGSGLTPTLDDVAKVHGFIRGVLGRLLGQAESEATRILYGGSVKPTNAAELLFVPDVNGALVGGASLKTTDFYGILAVYRDGAGG